MVDHSLALLFRTRLVLAVVGTDDSSVVLAPDDRVVAVAAAAATLWIRVVLKMILLVAVDLFCRLMQRRCKQACLEVPSPPNFFF